MPCTGSILHQIGTNLAPKRHFFGTRCQSVPKGAILTPHQCQIRTKTAPIVPNPHLQCQSAPKRHRWCRRCDSRSARVPIGTEGAYPHLIGTEGASASTNGATYLELMQNDTQRSTRTTCTYTTKAVYLADTRLYACRCCWCLHTLAMPVLT